MAEVEATESDALESAVEAGLESGTYEIIRKRLATYGQDLHSRLQQLNADRKDVFGGIDTSLSATERITTDNNCTPRDMVAVGDHFIFGYNVHFGLKAERHLSDVFSIYAFEDESFHPRDLTLLHDERFEKDFQDVYRYYKNAVFSRFVVSGPHLFMVFQVGKTSDDIKTFKWLIDDESLRYIDNRSDHELRFPPQHEFEWNRTHRELHRSGRHPHISIDDRVFVETVGGDLTIKIENNTESGEGIYAEEVDDKDQTLDDAEIYYAVVGNIILLKIRPYKERAFRYLVYNEKIRQARRLDAVEHACVLLPDDHGLIFSNGYYLQSGEHKTFDTSLRNVRFEKRVPATNGEDFLYVFYSPDAGAYVLLEYNLIQQRVGTPLICNGYTIFERGELICFKRHDDPQKHHAIQIWQTPYAADTYIPDTQSDSFLFKVGNRDIVRGMAECHEILALLEKDESYDDLYVDIVKKAGDIVDSYFWIGRDETFNLKEPLEKLREAASAAVGEFEKVVRLRQNTAAQTQQVSRNTSEVISGVNHKRFETIDEFVTSLAQLRGVRGEIVALHDLRYVDESAVDKIESEVAEHADRLARRCVEFLLSPTALAPYKQRIEEAQESIPELTRGSEAKQVGTEIAETAGELEMLIEIVSNLTIDDANQRTFIIDQISAIFAQVNQARAALKTKLRELSSVEAVAEFSAQTKLLNQGVVNYLDVCDTPERCEEYLTKLMIQIEELEGRFAEFDEFVIQLSEKREEIYNAFESRKVALLEARNKRANALKNAADRILKGIQSRVQSFEAVNDIHGYFASDLMIEKVRDIVEQLKELDDTVKVDDIQSRLKTIREDAVRQLKDRQELYVGGENVIQLGTHQFSVNVQALDLTTVIRDDRMYLHLTGTNFFEPVSEPQIEATRNVWDQSVCSENSQVYRGEFLAYQILQDLSRGSAASIDEFRNSNDAQLLSHVQRFAGPRYNEGYVKGVNDLDAAKILRPLLNMYGGSGLLRFHSQTRALATVFWSQYSDKKHKTLLTARLKGLAGLRNIFPDADERYVYARELQPIVAAFADEAGLLTETPPNDVAEYLAAQLSSGDEWVISRPAADLFDTFHQYLNEHHATEEFERGIKAVQRDPVACYILLRQWTQAFLRVRDQPNDFDYADEVAALLLNGNLNRRAIVEVQLDTTIDGLQGTHAVIEKGRYRLRFNTYLRKLREFDRTVVPRFNSYIAAKRQLVDQSRERLKIDEFRPRVLSSFVRNRLLDTVYLPMIGDNLAKQIGVVGEQKRTDRMGLLLLISPPGYGKTTLMEYLANRLGIIFMKINGPALGHGVTSVDPAAAPNAGAREEIEKLNLAFEMGDNVMIYLDDIQHCHPEFLQKFISLCDAQRKIEGVYGGKTRTYDFRGRKVAVVMAGNPYTESGEKFQIPDMLANRADIYNLGEIIGDSVEAFEMSYLENALTSNPVLSKLASRSQRDVYTIIKMANDGQTVGGDFEGNYTIEELTEFVSTMRKLMRVRDVILRVNREYIRSAAQADDYRTEPPFKLQGSYRNMNRIAEKVVAVMNDEELESLIISSYENDAQTLTTGTEANLLKFKELLEILTPDEAQRWNEIKNTFRKNTRLKGINTDDKFGQAIAQLSAVGDGLDGIRDTITAGMTRGADADTRSETSRQFATLLERMEVLLGTLDRMGSAVAESVQREPANLSESSLVPTSSRPHTAATQNKAAQDHTVDDETATIHPTRSSGAVSDSQTITVVNKIPRTMLNVVERQFELMQAWLEPLARASLTQQSEMGDLKRLLAECLHNYQRLVDGLARARNAENDTRGES